MPNVYGDKRTTMKTVDKMLRKMAEDRQAPKCDRETAYYPSTFIFGHYDSRGGAFITAAPGASKAIRKYIKNMFNEDPNDPYTQNSAMKDYLGQFEVVVIGGDDSGPLRPGAELLADDGGSFYPFRLHEKFPKSKEWYELNALVLIHKDLVKHKIGPEGDELEEEFKTPRVAPEFKFKEEVERGRTFGLKYWPLGEDACGLIVF